MAVDEVYDGPFCVLSAVDNRTFRRLAYRVLDHPPKAKRRQSRHAERQKRRVAELFEHRYLFVAHHLTPAQQRTLQRITRGLPHLRSLRRVMDQVYRLFDRRCRTDTALVKLARLRGRLRRYRAKRYEKAAGGGEQTETSNRAREGERRHDDEREGRERGLSVHEK